MQVARYQPGIAKCLPFMPTTKKALNKTFSAISQTTFCNGSKISEKTVQNNLAGRMFETPGLDSLEGSSFSLSCQPNLTLTPLTWRIWWAPNNVGKWQMGFNSALKGLIEYVVHSWHQQMLLRRKQIQPYITPICTSDRRLYLCASKVLLAVSRLDRFIR